MRWLLALIIMVLAVGDTFGFEFGLAPGLSIKNALLYVAFGMLVLQRIVSGRPKGDLVQLQLMFGLLVFYAIASVLFDGLALQLEGYEIIPQMIALKSTLFDHLIFFLTFFYATEKLEDGEFLIKVMAFAIAASSIATIASVNGIAPIVDVQYGNNDDFEGGRIHGVFGHANETGTLLVAMIPMYIALVENASGLFWRLVWLLCLASVAVMLLMTGSRGAMVGLLLGGGIATFLSRRYFSRKRVMFWWISAAIVLVPAAIYFAGSALEMLAARVATQTSGEVGNASSGRTDLWLDGIAALVDSPWTLFTGFGWGMWEHHKFIYESHNTYLWIWFELGLVGLLCFVAVLVGSTVRAAQAAQSTDGRPRAYLVAYVIGASALMVAILFCNLYKPWLYFWPLAAICMRIAVLPKLDAAGRQVERIPRAPPKWATRTPASPGYSARRV